MKRLAIGILPCLFLVTDLALALEGIKLPWRNHVHDPDAFYNSEEVDQGIFFFEFQISQCIHCASTVEFFKEIADEYAQTPRIQVLTLSNDRSLHEYARWQRVYNLNYPLLDASASDLMNHFHTRAYPTSFITDCNFNVLFRHVGPLNTHDKLEIRRILDEQLDQTCTRI